MKCQWVCQWRAANMLLTIKFLKVEPRIIQLGGLVSVIQRAKESSAEWSWLECNIHLTTGGTLCWPLTFIKCFVPVMNSSGSKKVKKKRFSFTSRKLFSDFLWFHHFKDYKFKLFLFYCTSSPHFNPFTFKYICSKILHFVGPECSPSLSPDTQQRKLLSAA